MKPVLLEYLCCPDCQGPFRLSTTDRAADGEIFSGSLECTACDSTYRITNGLPVILKEASEMRITQRAFGHLWTWQNEGRFEREIVYGQSEEDELADFKHAFDVSGWDDLSRKLVVDAGCGSGRLTAGVGRSAPGSTVIGLDISDAARVAFERSRGLDNVHIVQCDLRRPPLKPGAVDYVWSEGVIICTPDPAASFRSLDDLVRDEGSLYVYVEAAYKSNIYRTVRTLMWKPWILPQPVLYALSWVLAAGLYLALVVRSRLRSTTTPTLRTLVFGFYDRLSPEYYTAHNKDEVLEWYRGYRNVRIVGDLNVVGSGKRAKATAPS